MNYTNKNTQVAKLILPNTPLAASFQLKALPSVTRARSAGVAILPTLIKSLVLFLSRFVPI